MRATSADHSEDILVWTLRPKRIHRDEISRRKRRQPRKVPNTDQKTRSALFSMPEEDVPQLSADAPFRSIRNLKPIASLSDGFRASSSV